MKSIITQILLYAGLFRGAYCVDVSALQKEGDLQISRKEYSNAYLIYQQSAITTSFLLFTSKSLDYQLMASHLSNLLRLKEIASALSEYRELRYISVELCSITGEVPKDLNSIGDLPDHFFNNQIVNINGYKLRIWTPNRNQSTLVLDKNPSTFIKAVGKKREIKKIRLLALDFGRDVNLKEVYIGSSNSGPSYVQIRTDGQVFLRDLSESRGGWISVPTITKQVEVFAMFRSDPFFLTDFDFKLSERK